MEKEGDDDDEQEEEEVQEEENSDDDYNQVLTTELNLFAWVSVCRTRDLVCSFGRNTHNYM